MVECERYQMSWVVTHQDLVLDGHRHQVVQLVHAVTVELHDGGVRQLVEHCLENSPAVDWLVLLEDLLYESSVEHRGHDIVHDLITQFQSQPQLNSVKHQYLVGSIFLHHLSLESGINDVDHLPAEVDEEDREVSVGHFWSG